MEMSKDLYKFYIPSKKYGNMFRPDIIWDRDEVRFNDKIIKFWRADVIYNKFSAEVLFMNDGKFTCCFDVETFWLNRGEVEGYEEIPFHPQIIELIEKYCLDDLESQSDDILKELALVLLCYIRDDKIDCYSNSSNILKDILMESCRVLI